MLRVSEVYASYQGEGPNTGKPTVFVRFAGCNFTCAGWACDTPHAIDPKIYRKEQRVVTAMDLAWEVHALGIKNVCMTGGEPFLQQRGPLFDFTYILQSEGHTIEAFTNGSRPWNAVGKPITDHVDNFIMDWKLPGSGEFPDETNILQNLSLMSQNDAVKFTIKDDADYERARYIYDRYLGNGRVVFCGVVWDGEVTTERLAERMLRDKLPWHLNVQVHKYIWNADKRGV